MSSRCFSEDKCFKQTEDNDCNSTSSSSIRQSRCWCWTSRKMSHQEIQVMTSHKPGCNHYFEHFRSSILFLFLWFCSSMVHPGFLVVDHRHMFPYNQQTCRVSWSWSCLFVCYNVWVNTGRYMGFSVRVQIIGLWVCDLCAFCLYLFLFDLFISTTFVFVCKGKRDNS